MAMEAGRRRNALKEYDPAKAKAGGLSGSILGHPSEVLSEAMGSEINRGSHVGCRSTGPMPGKQVRASEARRR
jgi:hypothetical protein